MEDLYIITGITGFVGNVIAKTLIDKGYKVRGLARSKTKVHQVLKDYLDKIEIVYGDIKNKEDLDKLFSYEGKMYVIHTAALISVDSKKVDKNMYEINVLGTKNVVEYCKKCNVQKLIYISSSDAIKGNKKELIKEPKYYDETKLNGYGKTKALASQIVIAAKNDLDITILHPSSIIGPGDYSYTYLSQLISDFINHKLPASIKGGYNFVDVRDIVDIVIQIIEKGSKFDAYLITGHFRQITELLNTISDYKKMKRIKTLPRFLAYFGLPFVSIYFKIKKQRPLYTSYSLKTIKSKNMFDDSRLKEEFNFKYRKFEDSIVDQIEFMSK